MDDQEKRRVDEGEMIEDLKPRSVRVSEDEIPVEQKKAEARIRQVLVSVV